MVFVCLFFCCCHCFICLFVVFFQLSATAYTSMVISYYSLIRDVWEPILEPIMDPKDDEAPPILWFMKMKVCKLASDTPPVYALQ